MTFQLGVNITLNNFTGTGVLESTTGNLFYTNEIINFAEVSGD